MPIHDKQVEAVARAICPTLHDNPADWLFWVDEARAVLALPFIASALRLAEVYTAQPADTDEARFSSVTGKVEAYEAYRAARRDLGDH